MIIIHRELRLHASTRNPSGSSYVIIRFDSTGRTAELDGSHVRRLNRLHTTLRLTQRMLTLLSEPVTRVNMANMRVWLCWESARSPMDESVILAIRPHERGVRVIDDTRLDVAWVAVRMFTSWLSFWWTGLHG